MNYFLRPFSSEEKWLSEEEHLDLKESIKKLKELGLDAEYYTCESEEHIKEVSDSYLKRANEYKEGCTYKYNKIKYIVEKFHFRYIENTDYIDKILVEYRVVGKKEKLLSGKKRRNGRFAITSNMDKDSVLIK